MKRIINFQILLMSFLAASVGFLYPQHVNYQYDKTGNRTGRMMGTASAPVQAASAKGLTSLATTPGEMAPVDGKWVDKIMNGDTIREFVPNPIELLPPGFNPEVHGSLLNPAADEETTGSLQSPVIAPALFSGVPVTVEVDRTKDVGEIPISQAIQNGALMLSVPIELYPGRDGFQPQLSLTYSSMSGNGAAGFGWHIGGLSMITPVSSNFYYDGAAAKAETLGKDASYMLDGMRLIRRVAGSYRTEQGYTDATIDDQNSKYFFQVKYPDGRSATYGYTTHTTAQLSYPLTKMTDLSGNFMNCTYQLNSGVRNITEITYGCNGNTIGKVKFVYKTRTDTNPLYLAGSTIKQDQLLSSIQVYYKDQLLRTYTLEHSVKDFSFLSRIRCKAETKELNPLVFYYGTGDTMPSHMTETTSFLSSYFANSASTKLNYVKYKPDNLLPEDGLVVYPQFTTYGVQSYDSKGNNTYGSTYSATQEILVYKQLKGSTITPVKLTTGTGFQGLIPMDATGDGRDELVRINYTYASAGSNLSLTSYNTVMTGTTSNYALNGYVNEGGRFSPVPRTFLTGNFTGDGKIKLVAVSGNKSPKGASLGSSYMTVIDVEGKRMLHNRASVFSYDYFSDMLFTMDFDGDGRTEICHVNSTGLHVYTLINNDFVKLATYTGVTNKENRKMILLGDINGDGKTDIILTPSLNPYSLWSGKEHIGGPCEGCCRSPYNLVWTTWDEEFYYCDHDPNNLNGSYKRSCYLIESSKKTYHADAYDWKYLISTGKTFVATQIKKSFTYEGSNTFLLQDVNGDNFPDLVVKNGSQVSVYLNVNGKISTTPTLSRSIAAGAYLISGVTNNSYYLNNRMGQLLAINGANVSGLVFSRNEGLERKLSGAVNSLGVISKIQYAPMSSLSVYPASVTAIFPYTKVLMNEMLVNRTEVYLKGVQQENILYKYENGMVNRQLPGFRGFSKIISTDQKRSVTVTETYNPMQDGVLMALDTPVSSASYVYTKTVDAQKFKKLQLQSKTEKDKLNNFTTTSTYLYDTYNNVVQENRKVGTAEEVTIVNQYNNSPKIGELYNRTVTVKRGEHVWKERTYISSFQTTTRLPLKITTYVNDNQVLEVTREYTNGNLVKEQQKPFASTSSLNHTFTYNALGQLTGETNHLGLATTYTYNAKGGLTSSKNHKNKEIAYTYDDWSRLIKTLYPDATTATTAYAWVTAPAGALWRITTGTTGQPTVQTFYDALNRELRQGQMSFNGTYTYTDTQYDNQGRISKVSLPFKTMDPAKWNTYTYDTYDRPLSVKADAPSNKETKWSYSAGKGKMESQLPIR